MFTEQIQLTKINQIKKMANVMVAQGDGNFDYLYRDLVKRYRKGWITDNLLSSLDEFQTPWVSIIGDYTMVFSRKPTRQELKAMLNQFRK